jgi:large subunit ribosomal protein L15
MTLDNLRPASGSVKSTKRIARGQGSGHGGTATKGHKGDKSRSGYKQKRGHEGGQTPMHRRLPKRGFNNINREEFVPMNLSQLEAYSKKFGTTELSLEFLTSNHIVRANDRVKILGGGKLTGKVNITAHAISAAAKTAIEAVGGSVNLV